MDIAVRTGTTRGTRDHALVSLQLQTLQGEQVCLLMDIAASEKEAHAVEHECELVIKHALIESEGSAAERLDGALKELNGLLKGMIISGGAHDVHMIVSILDADNMLHVSHAGRGEAYLIRKGSASQITEYGGSRPTPAFVHIASGKLEPDDIVIFSTQRLLRTVTPAQLARLTVNRDMILESVTRALETEAEHAALAVVAVAGSLRAQEEDAPAPVRRRAPLQRPLSSRAARRGTGTAALSMSPLLAKLGAMRLPALRMPGNLRSWLPSAESVSRIGRKTTHTGASSAVAIGGWFSGAGAFIRQIIDDLSHPQRKKRAHLLLLAGAIIVALIVWATVHLFTSSQRSKTRAELEQLVEQIGTEIQTAENRYLAGDVTSADAILRRAEDRAKQVMDNESGLFRAEASELLGRIRAKEEEINNIVRLTPRTTADLSSVNADILARGFIGLDDGEFLAYDRQNVYRILVESVTSPSRLSDDVLVIDGANFPRYSSQVFLMNGNSVVEWQNDSPVSMKTDDPDGWQSGVAADAYLRYLYILSPEAKQIYKYERLSGRYGAPAEYNVSGDLTGAVDMAIDGNIYVLKKGPDGTSIMKLFRGEEESFVVRQAPADLLEGATKIFKIPERNFYLLDPEGSRVIVLSDGGATGESAYVKQYVLEGEQVGALQDLYVNPDESVLYVMDEKRMYAVDLKAQ